MALYTLPIGASYLINKEDYDIEVGLGTTLFEWSFGMRGDVIGSDQKLSLSVQGTANI